MATVADEDRESPAGSHGCHGTHSGYGGGRCHRPHLPLPCLQNPGKAAARVECLPVCVCVCRESWLADKPALYMEPDWLPGKLCYRAAKTMSAAKKLNQTAAL